MLGNSWRIWGSSPAHVEYSTNHSPTSDASAFNACPSRLPLDWPRSTRVARLRSTHFLSFSSSSKTPSGKSAKNHSSVSSNPESWSGSSFLELESAFEVAKYRNLLGLLDHQPEIFPIPREPSSKTPAHHVQDGFSVLLRFYTLVTQIEDKLPYAQE